MSSQLHPAQEVIRLPCTFGLILAAYISVCPCHAQPGILIRDNGTLELNAPPEVLGGKRIRMDFGLPAKAAVRRWQEGTISRSLWQSNEIDYTQTVFVAQPQLASPFTNTPVLLVEVAGANRATEYREATAELAVWLNDRRMDLELRSGFVWLREGEKRTRFAALDVPESGVKAAEGTTLLFHGNIPPSLDGSLVLKLPLALLQGEQITEWLHDLEFTRELRSTAKSDLLKTARFPVRFQTRPAEPK